MANSKSKSITLIPFNYKSSMEPIGGEKIHINLALPFEMWVLNDGYIGKLSKDNSFVKYTKTCKPTLEVTNKGAMNSACQKRYAVFLQQYLRNGKSFIEKLKAQAPKVMMVA